tara:strand:+ start:359 stop:733 length:375 start_codon:yes stop_codon:yes gene_type:complete
MEKIKQLKQEIKEQVQQACCGKAEKEQLIKLLETRKWEEGELRQMLGSLRRRYDLDVETFFEIATPIVRDLALKQRGSRLPSYQLTADLVHEAKDQVRQELKDKKIFLHKDRLIENLEGLARKI